MKSLDEIEEQIGLYRANVDEKGLLDLLAVISSNVPSGNLDLKRITELTLELLHTSADDIILEKFASILSTLLARVPLDQLLSNYQTLMITGITHSSVHLQLLAINCFNVGLTNVKKDSSWQNLLEPELLTNIWEALLKNDTKLGLTASECLFKLASFDDESLLNLVLSLENIKIIHEHQQNQTFDMVKKFRTLELLSRIASVSKKSFDKVSEAGLLEELKMRSTDLLAVLNTIEILSNLIDGKVEFQFLEDLTVFSFFKTILRDEDNHEVDSVLTKSYILKFYSKFINKQGELFVQANEKYNILQDIESLIDNPSKDVRDAVILFIGNGGSCYLGLCLLHHKTKLFSKLLDMYNSAFGDLKDASMKCLSQILTVGDNEGPEAASISDWLFRSIKSNKSTVSSLVQSCRSAFDETKIARYEISFNNLVSYSILNALTCHEWGLKELAGNADFLKFISSRESDGSRSGSEWKFSILQAIVTKKESMEEFDGVTRVEFGRYVREGPFYKEAVVSVATESL